MTIPQSVKDLLRQPDEANRVFAQDRHFPFSVRAGLINAYRRKIIQDEFGKGPASAPSGRRRSSVRGHRRYPKRVRVSAKPSSAVNYFVVGIPQVIRVCKSRGRNRVSTKRDVYYKTVPRVVHLTGTKDKWRKQHD